MSDYIDARAARAQEDSVADLRAAVGAALQERPAAAGESRVEVPPYLFAWVAERLDFQGALLLTHAGIDARHGAPARVAAVYALGPGKGILHVESSLPGGPPSYPALTPKLPAAWLAEQEARELLGIIPEGHPDPRPLLPYTLPLGPRPMQEGLARDWPLAPPYPFVETPVRGPGVSLRSGPGEAPLRLQLDGEVILRAELEGFTHHRGAERHAEGQALALAVPLAERLSASCAAASAYTLCAAAERIAGVLPPPRARALRVVLLELERVYVHAHDIARLCEALAFASGALAARRLQERAARLTGELFGNRLRMNALAPGGLRVEPGTERIRGARGNLPLLSEELDALMRAFDRDPSALARLRGCAALSYEDAIALSARGIIGRASGIDLDARRDHLYDGYRDYGAPNVSTDTAGDAAARLKLRVLELRESLALLGRVLSDLPEGAITAPLGAPAAQVPGVGIAEAPQGEHATYLILDGEGRVQRYRLRSASYWNQAALPLLVVGTPREELPLIEHSLALSWGCVER